MFVATLPSPSSTIEQGRYKIEFVRKLQSTRFNLQIYSQEEKDLNTWCISYTENSLKEDWDSENDKYWASYLTK